MEHAAPQHGHGPQHLRSQNLGGRIPLVSWDGPIASEHACSGRFEFEAPSAGSKGPIKFVNEWLIQSETQVCWYFSAGKCLRANCHFRWVPLIKHDSHNKPISLAMKSNTPYVASGCKEHVQRGRFVSFCTTSRQTLMWLVSLRWWAVLTWVRVLLLVSHLWTNFQLVLILLGTPKDVMGVIMGGIKMCPHLTTLVEAPLWTKMFCLLL